MAELELAAKVGGLREGVAAVRSLAELLRSPRVGSRTLERALPALKEGIGSLRASLQACEEGAALILGADAGARDAVRERFGDAMALTEALAVGLSLEGALDTRRRLALDASVHRLSAELEGVLAVAELLATASTARETLLDLGDVLVERWSAPRRAGAVSVETRIDGKVPFSGDARLVGALLDIAVALCARHGRACLSAGVGPRGPCVQVGPPGAGRRSTPPRAIPVTKSAVQAAAAAEAVVLVMAAKDTRPASLRVAKAAAALVGIELTGERPDEGLTLYLARCA